MDLTKKNYPSQLERLEVFCRENDYAGFCKLDALNSPQLEKLFGKSESSRLLVTRVVSHVPLPLRRWLGVPKQRDPKAIANFVRAYAALYKTDRDVKWRERAIMLADWLLRQESHELNAYKGVGRAWGYHYPSQVPGFFAPRNSPNCLVSAFVGEAMLSVFEITGKRKYLDAAFGVRDYLLRALPTLLENDREKCIGYVTSGLRWRVVHVNAIAGGYLGRLAVRTADRDLAATAQKMITWVCERRNADFTWDYTSPRDQSGIGPENFHTGQILSAIADYMTFTGDSSFREVYSKALQSYGEKAFQSAEEIAQGLITFIKGAESNAQCVTTRDRLAQLALARAEELKDTDQSEMVRALAEFVRSSSITLSQSSTSWDNLAQEAA